MEKARVQLLLDNPFFGYLGSYLQLEESDSLNNPISTDHKKLYYNPDFIEGLNESVLKTCIAHGILHTVLGHQWRRENRKTKTWNSATDLATNWLLKQSGFEIPPDSELRPIFKDKSAEEIYSLLNLEEERKKQKAADKNSQKEGRERKDETGGEESKSGKENAGQLKQDSMDDHRIWENLAVDQDFEQEEIAEEWKRRAAESYASARGEGKMPEALERLVDEILEPTLNWRRILRRYILQHAREDYDWMRPDRRLLQYGVYYPSPHSERLDLAVAVDTSGSIRDDDIELFLSEVKGILESVDSYRARLLACDAKLHTDISVGRDTGLDVERTIDKFSESLKGRGGTKYSPVFEALDDERVQVLVYLTDGRCSEEIEEPNFDVIWAITEGGTKKHIKFGKIIKLEEKNF